MAAGANTTKSENGNASEEAVTAATADYTAHPPPPGPSEKPAGSTPSGGKLTAAQAEMHRKVLEHFQSESYELPGVQDSGELREEEKFWLSNDCMLRYLRATKWASANAAIERLEGTLKWRREYGIYDLTADLVEPEAVTGKQIIFGYDTHRRPALYMIPSRQNTEESPRQIQHTVWMLERAIDLTGPGVESLVLMINYVDKGKNPSFATSKLVLNILQTHYPERLGASLILNVPFLLHAFYRMISPLIDPITRNKMKFNPKPVQDGLFAADELFKDSGWGGAREFVWDHDKYWGSFVRMCDEIRAAQMARWRKLGARVGCDEWDYKTEAAGGDTAIDEKSPAPQAQVQDQDQGVAVAVGEGAAAVPEDGDTEEQTPASQAQAQDQDQSPTATDDVVASGGGSEDQSPPEADSEATSEAIAPATAI